MNAVRMPRFALVALLLSGTFFLQGCAESLLGDEASSAHEHDGSVGAPVEITVDKAASPATVTFDDLGPLELVLADRYAAHGIAAVKINPVGSGTVRGTPGAGPCDGTRALMTLPQTGPTVLFNFAEPVSFVSIEAGDFGPSDADAMTIWAYSEADAGGSLLGTAAQTLAPGHPTGCLPLSVSAPGIRSVKVTSTGPSPNSILFDNLYVEGGVEVTIDVKPGSDRNPINMRSRGVVPVALLGSDTFDVAMVEVATLAFGPEGAAAAHDLSDPDTYAGHLEDVDGDGFMDLVSHYRQQQTGLEPDHTEACLTGVTTEGAPFEGCDHVEVFGSK